MEINVKSILFDRQLSINMALECVYSDACILRKITEKENIRPYEMLLGSFCVWEYLKGLHGRY